MCLKNYIFYCICYQMPLKLSQLCLAFIRSCLFKCDIIFNILKNNWKTADTKYSINTLESGFSSLVKRYKAFPVKCCGILLCFEFKLFLNKFLVDSNIFPKFCICKLIWFSLDYICNVFYVRDSTMSVNFNICICECQIFEIYLYLFTPLAGYKHDIIYTKLVCVCQQRFYTNFRA